MHAVEYGFGTVNSEKNSCFMKVVGEEMYIKVKHVK